VGAFTFIFLKSELMGATQYWRFFLGVTLALIVVLLPRGVMGVATDAWVRVRERTAKGAGK
jgi:branched-chain amino acid transport system permease protein